VEEKMFEKVLMLFVEIWILLYGELAFSDCECSASTCGRWFYCQMFRFFLFFSF